ncbi:hypothetical protein P153DRAFT_253500, partial [Dothidotthia symphoricarpi CBS 119687]
RFLDLPAELRMEVYKLMIPHDLIISFQQTIIDENDPDGFVIVSETKKSKNAILYTSNTYLFIINSQAHSPLSLRSPQIFGLWSHPTHLPLLRNLPTIHLSISLDHSPGVEHWTVTRQRARLAYFVEILNQHANDKTRKSLLQHLVINVSCIASARHNPKTPSPPLPLPSIPVEKFMFALESLAALRGVQNVQITGVPDWFARCLQLCIRGRGGDVREVVWPVVEVVRKRGVYRKARTKWVTTRKWYQPMLDWREFAQRNGVVMPDGVDALW